MKKLTVRLIVVFLVLSSLLLASCASASNTPPTLTFTDEGCSYGGPKTISPKFTLTRVVTGDSHESFAYVVGFLTSEKTMEDMAAWNSNDPPEWFTMLSGDKMVTWNSTTTRDYDFAPNAAYNMEPLIIVCFLDDMKVGQVGPIKVK